VFRVGIRTGEQVIAAIIPAYNEEVSIGSVVLRSMKQVNEVIVIDDGSTDGTAAVAELAGAHVIRVPMNSGKANAVRVGFRFLRTNGFTAAVMLDGDGQHNPDEIGNLLAPILNNEADLVVGSRFLDHHNGIPRYRRLGQSILNGATNFGAKEVHTDSQSGFRALSRKALDSMDFTSDGYNIESDMIMHLSSLGFRTKEVPITVKYDAPNMHKKNSVMHGMGVFSSVIGFIGYRRPLLVFGVPGFIMFLIGIVLGILSLGQEFLFGWGWLFQSMGAVLLIIVGLILGIAALTLNSLMVLMKINQTKL
jgi:glycosyltransferase involved in cell wall biosynthesis